MEYTNEKMQVGDVYTITILKAPTVSSDLFFTEELKLKNKHINWFNLPLLFIKREEKLFFLYENNLVYVYETFLSRLVEFEYVKITKIT